MRTTLTMIQSVQCVNSKRTKEVISCSICAVVQRNKIRLGTSVWVFRTNLPGLIRSFAGTGEEPHLHFDSAKRVAEAAVESVITRFQRTGSTKRWDGTFFTTWSTPLFGNLSKVDRKKAERINQELQKNLRQTFQTEAAIDLACDQDQVLRWHFPQTARNHKEKILPPDLEEIYKQRHLVQEEDEDDEIKTARPLSEWEKRELFRQHRNLGHPQPTELARALRHAKARREAFRFVLKELRCPTCEARPLPLPRRPGMLSRCLRFNQCIRVDLVPLEVRDGTSAEALNVAFFFTDEKKHSHNSNAHTKRQLSSPVPHTLRATAWSHSTSCEGDIWPTPDHPANPNRDAAKDLAAAHEMIACHLNGHACSRRL